MDTQQASYRKPTHFRIHKYGLAKGSACPLSSGSWKLRAAQISFISEAEKGTKFAVTLPLTR